MTQSQIQIRPAAAADFEPMRQIFDAHVGAGETYSFEPGTPRATFDHYWFGPGVASYVALDAAARVLGMYRLAPNQPGRGAHVANGSYMVGAQAQGAGVGTLLGRHSLIEARRLGYLAIQFNFVVSTNHAAVALWRKLGFSIVATLPKAYRHRRLGYVDAYVMYQLLRDPSDWPAARE